MKVRCGFVSNSSSSSFIVFNNETLIPSGIRYIKLNKKQKIRLIQQGYIDSVKDDIFLTEFVSDSINNISELYHLVKCEKAKEYHNGGHGYPYDEEMYDEIDDDIWLYKGTEEQNED